MRGPAAGERVREDELARAGTSWHPPPSLFPSRCLLHLLQNNFVVRLQYGAPLLSRYPESVFHILFLVAKSITCRLLRPCHCWRHRPWPATVPGFEQLFPSRSRSIRWSSFAKQLDDLSLRCMSEKCQNMDLHSMQQRFVL